VEETINKIRRVQKEMDEAKTPADRERLHQEKSRLKKQLPAFLFQVGHIEPTERIVFGKPMKAAWRKAENARLNGLVMLDADGVENPAERFQQIVDKWNSTVYTPELEQALFERDECPGWCGAFCRAHGILLVHVTPSGKGLRIVFAANGNYGNIAHNQERLARLLELPLDEACKDSVRLSFGFTRRDIIYIELEKLLTYDNEEFEKEYGAHPQPLPKGGESNSATESLPQGGGLEGAFHSSLCLSYLTIENRGAIPPEAASKMGHTFYGCDRCQQACPWNAKAIPTSEPLLQPTAELLSMNDEDWQQLSLEQYRRLFKGSAVKRAKYEGLMRNIKAIQHEQDQ